MGEEIGLENAVEEDRTWTVLAATEVDAYYEESRAKGHHSVQFFTPTEQQPHMPLQNAIDKFFPPSLLEPIMLHTNQCIAGKRSQLLATRSYADEAQEQSRRASVNRTYCNTDAVEFHAFLGVMYRRAYQNWNAFNSMFFWSPKCADEAFSASMPCIRFRIIMSSLRFDDKTTRAHRVEADSHAAMRDVITEVNKIIKKYWELSESVTIDECLYATRLRGAKYEPKKPHKYGIMWQIMAGSREPYAYHVESCCSRQPLGMSQKTSGEIVERFAGTLPTRADGKRFVMVGDRWYSGLPTANNLLVNQNCGYLGIIQQRRVFLPVFDDYGKGQTLDNGQCLFLRSDNVQLVLEKPSNASKQNRFVGCISTVDTEQNILLHRPFQRRAAALQRRAVDKRKSEQICRYNKDKNAVDWLDKSMSLLSVRAATRKHTVNMFMFLLDILAIDLWQAYKSAEPQSKVAQTKHAFLGAVSDALIRPAATRRFESENRRYWSRKLTLRIATYLGCTQTQLVPTISTDRRQSHQRDSNNGRCQQIVTDSATAKSSACNKNTYHSCDICNAKICPRHSATEMRCFQCL